MPRLRSSALRVAMELRGISEFSAVPMCADSVNGEVQSVPGPRRARSTARGDRDMLREQRRLEIERQLREQLGLKEVDPAPVPPPRSRASSSERSRPSSSDRRGVTCEVGSAFSARSSTKRVPARPPKPKPHRPLSFQETPQLDADHVGGQAGRWRSALLPVWPDRARQHPCDPNLDSQTSACASGSASHTTSPSAVDTLVESHTSSLMVDFEIPGVRDQGTGWAGGGERRVAGVSELVSAQSCAPGAALVQSCWDPGGVAALQVFPRKGNGPASEPVLLSVAAAEAARQKEEECAKKAHVLEESTRRLQENAERLRVENRRARIIGRCRAAEPDTTETCEDPCDVLDEVSGQSFPCSLNEETLRKLEQMRRKITELDETNLLEQKKLEAQQQEAEERRREQEEFERSLQLHTEKEIREHQECEAREAERLLLREERERRKLEERGRRRQQQMEQEQTSSKRLEEKRFEARSDSAQVKWQVFEEELDRHWAEQEAEERRRMEEYAAVRRRQFEEWDRKLMSERQRFATTAEFRDTANFQKVRNAANADNQFRHSRASASPNTRAPQPRPWAPPTTKTGLGVATSSIEVLPEERSVIKEFNTVRGATRDAQKAKVKELLFKWHPDKNPECVEKATRVFQFVQTQRGLMLGL